MKQQAKKSGKLPLMLVMAALAGALPGRAAPPAPATPATPAAPPKSVFILPTKPQEGRDPFFPNSSRPYEEARALHPGTIPAVPTLKVETILMNQKGEAFAVINDQTFAAGDEGDVITKAGRRVHLHCLAIDPRKNTVTVETGGVHVTLNYTGN